MTRPADSVEGRGVAGGAALALGAYLLWGLFPLYFLLLRPSGPWEVVSWRIVLALPFCLVLLAVTRSWPRLLRVIRTPRLLALTALAGVLIYVNWQVYLIATLTGHVIESSLGYFINPLVTVLLGVLVLGERLRPAQWTAVGIAAVAVIVIVVGYGGVPWIALTLATSFGLYGLVKKRIGPAVDATTGLTLETAWLLPLALVQLAVVGATSGVTLFTAGAGHAVLLLLAGALTAVPLLMFASAARRVPLSLLGLLQFVTPILQFAIGAGVLGEPMPPERWAGFALVWVALLVLSADSLITAGRGRAGASDLADLA